METAKFLTVGRNHFAKQCFLNRQQGITVILVTHDPKIAAFTDRAINMADGLICEGISDMLSKDV